MNLRACRPDRARGLRGSAWRIIGAHLLALTLAACATSPVGRPQLIMVPDAVVDRMGTQAFTELRAALPASEDEAARALVECVVDAIAPHVNEPHAPTRWHTFLIADSAVNAFALPGGYIGVYEGLLGVAANADQLATVIGHEMAHVTARHAAERISQHQAAEFAVRSLAGRSPGTQRAALLGLGVQVGVLLPFSRTQETEADLLGLDYIARAGFHPEAAIELWRNMAAEQRHAPPEFLSTHPGAPTRIRDLQARMPEAMRAFEAARAAGREPRCES